MYGTLYGFIICTVHCTDIGKGMVHCTATKICTIHSTATRIHLHCTVYSAATHHSSDNHSTSIVK